MQSRKSQNHLRCFWLLSFLAPAKSCRCPWLRTLFDWVLFRILFIIASKDKACCCV